MTDSRRRRLSSIHDLCRAALAEFGVQNANLKLLRHEHNTTFRIDTGKERSVLRINRPSVHNGATIGSEMLWLAALGRDTDVGVPKPVQACTAASTWAFAAELVVR
jgi:Ser/Thr protein kinase RdoA (MazF antagonist)